MSVITSGEPKHLCSATQSAGAISGTVMRKRTVHGPLGCQQSDLAASRACAASAVCVKGSASASPPLDPSGSPRRGAAILRLCAFAKPTPPSLLLPSCWLIRPRHGFILSCVPSPTALRFALGSGIHWLNGRFRCRVGTAVSPPNPQLIGHHRGLARRNVKASRSLIRAHNTMRHQASWADLQPQKRARQRPDQDLPLSWAV